MTVRAILESKGHHIDSVEPDAKLSAAIKMLAERRIGAVLVMSQGASRASCRSATSCGCWANAAPRVLDEPVSAVMTRKVVSCRQPDTVGEIMEMMTSANSAICRWSRTAVVGLISIGDIVKWRVREFESEQQALQDYIKTA